MPETINLGFIGTGAWARARHLPALDYIRTSPAGGPDLRLRGVCSLNKQEAAEVAEQYGFERVYETIDELVADDVLDAVAAVVMPVSLEQILPKLVGAGLPVLSEKPPGVNHEQAKRFADMVTVPNVVGFNRRYFPIVEKFKAVADELRDAYYVECSFYRHERLDSKWHRERGEGIPFVTGTAIHGINVLEYFFGPVRACRTTPLDVPSGDMDAWLANLDFESGLAGRIRILPCCGSATEGVEVHGRHRSLYCDFSMYSETDYPGRIVIHEAGKLKEVIQGDASEPRLVNEGFVGEYLDLFRAITDGPPTRSSFQNAANSMRVAEAIESNTEMTG